jgi:hypothetical protein
VLRSDGVSDFDALASRKHDNRAITDVAALVFGEKDAVDRLRQ